MTEVFFGYIKSERFFNKNDSFYQNQVCFNFSNMIYLSNSEWVGKEKYIYTIMMMNDINYIDKDMDCNFSSFKS